MKPRPANPFGSPAIRVGGPVALRPVRWTGCLFEDRISPGCRPPGRAAASGAFLYIGTTLNRVQGFFGVFRTRRGG